MRRSLPIVKLALAVVSSAILCEPTVQGNSDTLFGFELPWDDSTPNLTDFSYLNSKPAGLAGHVNVGPDGHLYSGEERIRFLGINLTYKSCMPEHEDAEKIARRLAKFGINVVRFHHMDSDWSGPAIFDPSYSDTRHLNPESLDKLDYFVAQLKKNGIYSNINLLVGRRFRSSDGLSDAIDGMDWKAKQTPAMFDPDMISLQKEFASQLLDRVNPYTELSYSEDPAIAFVEIVNEHGLLRAWQQGMLDNLPLFYAEQLRSLWNDFLNSKYANQSELEKSWVRISPPGPQLLMNGDFHAGLQYWWLGQHQGAEATATVINQGPFGEPAVRIQVTEQGTQNWHIQFNQGNLGIEEGEILTVHFWARADRSKSIEVLLDQGHDPWEALSPARRIQLTGGWQEFNFFISPTASDHNARMVFRALGDQLATYWIADVSLTAGGSIGLLPGENLDTHGIRLFHLNDLGQRTEAGMRNFAEFLWEQERSYWSQMRDYLKQTLGIQALLIGTAVGYSTPNLMSLFDVVDTHGYWQHPSFEVSWGSPWWIRNASMVREIDGGRVSDFSVKRVHGKPFSISEYNHPFPSSFATEAFFFLAAYAAFQDWDAIYAYTYADGTLDWQENRQNGYFDIQHNPGKMISLAHSACLFRRQDVRAGIDLVTGELLRDDELELLPSLQWGLVDGGDTGLERQSSLLHRVSTLVEDSPLPGAAIPPDQVNLPGNHHFISDTGELDWDPAEGVIQINTEKSKGVLGYIAGQSFDLGKIQIRPLSSLQGWAAIFVSELDTHAPMAGTRRMLLSAHGLIQNEGLSWRRYPSNAPAGFPPPADTNLTLGDWGSGPIEAEGIDAEIALAYEPWRVSVSALDGRGEQKKAVPVLDEEGSSSFKITGDYETLWYEIVVRPVNLKNYIPALQFQADEFMGIAVSNPSDYAATLKMTAYGAEGSLGIFPQNPTVTTLQPRNQFAKIAEQIFGIPVQTPVNGWLEIASDNPAVAIFAQSGNYSLTRQDGAAAVRGISKRLYLSRIHEGPNGFRGISATTTIFVANPTNASASIELILNSSQVDRFPAHAAVITKEIAPQCLLSGTIHDLFSANISEGYLTIEVIEGEGVAAYSETELLDRDTIFALNAQPPATQEMLYSAQFADLPAQLFTSLKLINVSAEEKKVEFKVVNDEGLELGEPLEVVLQAGEAFVKDSGELISSSWETASEDGGFIGSLQVAIVGGGGVLGDVVFGLPGLEYAAAMQLQSTGMRTAVFGQLADIPGSFFSGLALYNPNPAAAMISIRAYSQDGTLIGETMIRLEPGHRLSKTFPQLIPQTSGQLGGYAVLESDMPVVAQETFGTESLTQLSAVPPVMIE